MIRIPGIDDHLRPESVITIGRNTHYLCFRPHQGLRGTYPPAEAFLGIEPATAKAIKPPRGRSGEGATDPPFIVDFLDRQKRAFPFLKAA